MTRINTINPRCLLDSHLIAEWRELPRIPNTIISGKAKIDFKKIPDKFCLGIGHAIFFYNKLTFLEKRHAAICKEMDKRGIKRDPTIRVDLSRLPDVYRVALCNDYQPTIEDQLLSIDRICERFELRKKPYRFHGAKVDDDHAFNRYLKIVAEITGIII